MEGSKGGALDHVMEPGNKKLEWQSPCVAASMNDEIRSRFLLVIRFVVIGT